MRPPEEPGSQRTDYDVIIIGAGPAGSTCAAFCAKAGLRTLVIEKSRFPREKVCGDCVNPGCWPILERLGAGEAILALPHSKIRSVEFIDRKGRSIEIPVGSSKEISVKRSLFDQSLLDRAIGYGAEVIHGEVVQAITPGWNVQAGHRIISSKVLVAADGRNSTVARLLGLAPALVRDRVALQTHLCVDEAPGARAGLDQRIVMRQLPGGYCGLASLGENLINLCLVSWPEGILSLKQWAIEQYAISPEQTWHTITPLSRAPLKASHPNLLLVGDAALVVEPFTGEGIYYALASGELAAKTIGSGIQSGNLNFNSYEKAHADLYRGRLWINRLAKEAMVRPFLGDLILNAGRWHPGLLRALTSKVLKKA